MNGRNRSRNGDSGRDPGGFVALPWSVLDSAAYADLSHPAKSLLLEIARQFVRNNNGRLLASRAYLATRGWKSADVISRAKRELLEAGLIYETVKGQRPNKASWYAITWQTLDRHAGYDAGAVDGFVRGAYRQKLHTQIAGICPPYGTGKRPIGPSHGTGAPSPVPSHGPVGPGSHHPPVPSRGHHLEKPSATAVSTLEQ